ncbi:hypothetical protein LLH23_23940 [bacterium]|nr:hypothetical protein [bacterium]
MELRLVRARRIYADGTHCAFTGITRYEDQVLVCFRSGVTHVSWEGRIRIIGSGDGETWTPLATLTHPDMDLRDPKLATWQGAALAYCGGRRQEGPLQSFVSIAADGRTFGPVQPLQGVPEGYWLWSVRPHGDWIYGAAYRHTSAVLLRSADGVGWEQVAPFPIWGNEVSFDFDAEGRLWALVREDWQGCVPALCVAEPPYTEFASVRRLPIRLQGPMLKRLEEACVIVGRRWDEPGRRNLRADVFVLEDGHDLQYIRALPSGGDTSYAGWLDDGPGRGLISYYSSHEYKMDVDWADEAASTDTAVAEHSTPSGIFLADVRYR